MPKPPRPPKPKKPPTSSGHGDIVLSIGEDEPAPSEPNELARWTGDVLLSMDRAEAVAMATDILLANRNAKEGFVQIWVPASTVRVYKPE
jgi:hypothetical protein